MLPGVIAQIKWLAVGSRGESYMKNVVREAIAKESKTKCWGDGDMHDMHDMPNQDGNEEDESMVASPNMVATAIAAKLGGAVRLRELSKNIVVFDLMENEDESGVKTWRMGYHFDGTQFMFGDPERVKPVTVFLPEGEEGESEEHEANESNEQEYDEDGLQEAIGMESVKAPTNAQLQSLTSRIPTGSNAVPDVLPQERVTGDILRGHGPRRGNLERLLRYWRPIMRQEGGFRRCRVILADHPELYPLNNICAWLHHETTGLWPNEGCHHPGMKNCRRKLRNVVRGSVISDSDFESRMRRLGGGKSALMGMVTGEHGDVTEEDIKMANDVLRQFMEEEKSFMEYLADESNWMHVGDDGNGIEVEHGWVRPMNSRGCGCGGCGGGKSAESDLDVKAGRAISNMNLSKIQQAITLLQQVVSSGSGPAMEMKKKSDFVTLDEFIEPVLDYHGIEVDYSDGMVTVVNQKSVSADGLIALDRAIEAYKTV